MFNLIAFWAFACKKDTQISAVSSNCFMGRCVKLLNETTIIMSLLPKSKHKLVSGILLGGSQLRYSQSITYNLLDLMTIVITVYAAHRPHSFNDLLTYDFLDFSTIL